MMRRRVLLGLMVLAGCSGDVVSSDGGTGTETSNDDGDGDGDGDGNPPQILSFTADGNASDFALDHVEWIQLEADVIDDLGVQRVEFYAGDLLVGVDDAAPYEAQWLMNSATQSGTLLKVKAVDTSDLVDWAGPIQVDNDLPECGTLIWSTVVEGGLDWAHSLQLDVMPGGDVLAHGAVEYPVAPPCSDGSEDAYFARYDGTDGAFEWSRLVTTGACLNDAFGVAWSDDHWVYGFFNSKSGLEADDPSVSVVAYDEDGSQIGPLSSWDLLSGRDVTVSADGRIFWGGWSQASTPYKALVEEIDPATGLSLESAYGDWHSNLQSIDAFDAFANGEFAIIGHDDRLARITIDEQVVWSLHPTPENGYQVIDVGGPIETIAARRQLSTIEVLDADGTPRWQLDGRSAEVDPNGDVFMLVGVGEILEKRAGANGAVLCSWQLPVPAFSLALDGLGFPITQEGGNEDAVIAKYSP